MGNKKVCDLCDKEIGVGNTIGEYKNFVYTIKTSLVYYNPHRSDLLEPKEKSINNVEICDNCYNKHIRSIFSWRRELIVYPDVYVIGKALHRINDKLNKEWNRHEITAKYDLYLEDLLKKIGIENG